MIIISMKFLCDDLLRFESDDGFAIVSKRFNGLHWRLVILLLLQLAILQIVLYLSRLLGSSLRCPK